MGERPEGRGDEDGIGIVENGKDCVIVGFCWWVESVGY